MNKSESTLDEFQYPSYVRPDTLKNYKEKMLYIQNKIKDELSNFENFEGIDFCDVSANGIQVRGHHKKVRGYTYGFQPTINYDFSNVEEIVESFVNAWKREDNPEDVKSYLDFIHDGQKYGWD